MKKLYELTMVISSDSPKNVNARLMKLADRQSIVSSLKLKGYNVSKAIGYWQGKAGRSFIVTGFTTYDELLKMAFAFGWSYDQEAVLLQGVTGDIELMYMGMAGTLDYTIEPLSGKLKPITEQQASKLDCCTKFNNQYWAVV